MCWSTDQCSQFNKCVPRFRPHGIKIVHDVYIVLISWHRAQGQFPAIDIMFCTKVIEVDTYGFGSKSSTEHFKYYVNVQFNKIPQLAMGLQRERHGSMIPQGIGWRFSQTP